MFMGKPVPGVIGAAASELSWVEIRRMTRAAETAVDCHTLQYNNG